VHQLAKKLTTTNLPLKARRFTAVFLNDGGLGVYTTAVPRIKGAGLPTNGSLTVLDVTGGLVANSATKKTITTITAMEITFIRLDSKLAEVSKLPIL
jgi:hypothetical protein